jgi:hypothetical protein
MKRCAVASSHAVFCTGDESAVLDSVQSRTAARQYTSRR